MKSPKTKKPLWKGWVVVGKNGLVYEGARTLKRAKVGLEFWNTLDHRNGAKYWIIRAQEVRGCGK